MRTGLFKSLIVCTISFIVIFVIYQKSLTPSYTKSGEITRMMQLKNQIQEESRDLAKLSHWVTEQINRNQNPMNCSVEMDRFLVANIIYCGIGCMINTFMVCFQMAFFSGRVFIVRPNNQLNARIYGDLLKPLSDTCSRQLQEEIFLSASPSLSEEDLMSRARDKRHLICPTQGIKISFRQSAIPEPIYDKLLALHEMPTLWFLGQLNAYLMRAQDPVLLSRIQRTNSQIQGSSPSSNLLVGVHIRRTDKLKREAKFYPLAEYMQHVETIFQAASSKRRVLLISDERSVFDEMKQAYPQYELIVPDWDNINLGKPGLRDSPDGYRAILHDILSLSMVDCLVCTYSSNVCRIAYQLMQSRLREDGSRRIISLDSRYHINGGDEMLYVVMEADANLGLSVGDIVMHQGVLEMDEKKMARIVKKGANIDKPVFIEAKKIRPNFHRVKVFS